MALTNDRRVESTAYAAASEAPPHAGALETAVLAGLLYAPWQFPAVARVLTAGDFYAPRHAVLFEAIEALVSRTPALLAESTDGATLMLGVAELAAELQRRGRLQSVGGVPFLGQLIDVAHAALPSRIPALAHELAQIARSRDSLRFSALAAQATREGDALEAADYAAEALAQVTRTEAWEKPIPLADGTVPSFPAGVFEGALGHFVEATRLATQTPRDMAGMLALGALSTACAGRFVVQPKPRDRDYQEPVNLFLAVAAEPGTRKSAVFSRMMAPIHEHERDVRVTQGPDIAAAIEVHSLLEARLNRLREQVKKGDAPREVAEECGQLRRELTEKPRPVWPRYFTSDATPESLGALLSAQRGRMAILSPEGDGVFKMMAGLRYQRGAGDPTVYLVGHSGDAYTYDRKSGDSFRIERTQLTVALATQPGTLATLTRNGLEDLGLPARFLYSVPASVAGYQLGETDPVPDEVRAAYHAAVRAVLALQGAGHDEHGELAHVLVPDAEASAIWQAHRDGIEVRRREGADLSPKALRYWSAKLAGATARVAGLLHVIERVQQGDLEPWNTAIGAEVMRRAVFLSEGYLVAHARAAFDAMQASPEVAGAQKLLAWLQREGRVTFTGRDAHRAIDRKGRRVDLTDPVLEVLEAHGFIRPVHAEELGRQGKRRGRPPELYRLNPRAFDEQGPARRVVASATAKGAEPAPPKAVRSEPRTQERAASTMHEPSAVEQRLTREGEPPDDPAPAS